MRPCVVSHLNAEATQFAMGGIDLFQENTQVKHVCGLLIFSHSLAAVGSTCWFRRVRVYVELHYLTVRNACRCCTRSASRRAAPYSD
jgi:hypothetical protein